MGVDERDEDAAGRRPEMPVEIVEIVEEMQAVLGIEEDKTLLLLEAGGKRVGDTEAQEVLT